MRTARRARHAGRAAAVKPAPVKLVEKPVEEEMSSQEERESMRKQISEKTNDSMRMTPELSALIIERYNELLKDMALNDDSLDNVKLTDEEKNLINKKVELWLEYFISTATFRDDDVNLFDYLDSFNKTQKFL